MKKAVAPGVRNGLGTSSGPAGLAIDLIKNGAIKHSTTVDPREMSDAIGALLVGAFFHHARRTRLVADMVDLAAYTKGGVAPAAKVDLIDGPRAGMRSLEFQVGASSVRLALADADLLDLSNKISVALAPRGGKTH